MSLHHVFPRPWQRLLPLALGPFLVAWQGSGKSEGTLTTVQVEAGADGRRDVARTLVDAVARIQPGSTQIVLVITLPGERDAVMTLEVRADWGVKLELPNPQVAVIYEEFDRAGETRFLAHEATGSLETVFRTSGAVSLHLAMRFEDQGANRAVEFSDVAVTLIPEVVGPEKAEEMERADPGGGSLTASSGGCEDDGYQGTTAEDSSWNSTSSSDTSGGCDSDSEPTDSSSDSSSSSSGCEGDDLESSSDSDSASSSDSCDGDAAAAVVSPAPTLGRPPRVRAPLAAKLVAWLPYLLVLVPLRFLSPRRRLAVRR